MSAKVFISSVAAAGILGLGVMVGSVSGAGGASAQTPSATPTAATSATAQVPATADPGLGLPKERHHGPGMHRGGFSRKGFDGQIWGGGVTADNAGQQIISLTNLISLVKSDLAATNGKMDTASLTRWISGAEELLASAREAASNSQYGQALAYARAAQELAMLARQQMVVELGAENLPSSSQLPARRSMPQSVPESVTQAQASRVMADAYNRLVAEGALIARGGNAAQATTYLDEARNAYRDAYNAYQAGDYGEAVSDARLSHRLTHVASGVARASSAPANADTPVTVPAPSF